MDKYTLQQKYSNTETEIKEETPSTRNYPLFETGESQPLLALGGGFSWKIAAKGGLVSITRTNNQTSSFIALTIPDPAGKKKSVYVQLSTTGGVDLPSFPIFRN